MTTKDEINTIHKEMTRALHAVLTREKQPALPRLFRLNGEAVLSDRPNLLFTVQGQSSLTHPWIRVYDQNTEKAYCAFVSRVDGRKMGKPHLSN